MFDEQNESKYLLPVDDGLPMRASGEWAKVKLSVLGYYIDLSTVAMHRKPWRRRYYIDLQAGPGKNVIENTGEIMLGSPLLALLRGKGYTDYRLIENNEALAAALWRRCEVTHRVNRSDIRVADFKTQVEGIVEEIREIDRPFIRGQWHTLTLAFFDPEGLELDWNTVALLASLNRIDLIINFSTNGVRRAAGQALNQAPGTSAVDRFFGTLEWRNIPFEPDGSPPVRKYLDLYKSRLESIGFSWGTEISVPIKTTFGVELYRLLYASKSKNVGVEFWEKARMNAPEQRSLF